MDYNNTFDALIKKAVDNADLPMPADAWSEFESFRSGGAIGTAKSSQSFFTHFIAAGVALAVTVGAINMSITTDSAHNQDSHTTSISHPNGTSTTDLTDTHMEFIDIANESSEKTNKELLDKNVADNLVESVSHKDQKTIVRINTKLNDKGTPTQSNWTPTKETKRTTKYVGKDFNLDAPSNFSPNGDGINDSFIPTALTRDAVFEMVVRNEKDQVLYKTSDVKRPWTGLDQSGNELPEGKYKWTVSLQENTSNSIFRGTVKLHRK